MARPTSQRLTEPIQKRVLAALRAGAYLQTAAHHAGITPGTLNRWLRQGARARSGRYHAFTQAVQKALADAELADLATIRQAAQGHEVVKIKKVQKKQRGEVLEQTETTRQPQWTAAAWRLERRHPERYARRRGAAGRAGRGPKTIVTGFESADAPGPDASQPPDTADE